MNLFSKKTPGEKRVLTSPPYNIDHDILAHAVEMGGLWKKFGISAIVLAGLALLSTIYLASRPTPDPVVIEVDRTTGGAKAIVKMNDYFADSMKSDIALVNSFVMYHESYLYPILQYYYNNVKAMSSVAVFDAYAKPFIGDKPKDKVIGDSINTIATIESLIEVEKGFVQVNYLLVTRDASGKLKSEEKRTGFVRFKYDPERAKGELALRYNPSGFVVTSFTSSLVTGGNAAPSGTPTQNSGGALPGQTNPVLTPPTTPPSVGR